MSELQTPKKPMQKGQAPLRLTSTLSRNVLRKNSIRAFKREDSLFLDWFESTHKLTKSEFLFQDHEFFSKMEDSKESQLHLIFAILSRRLKNTNGGVPVEAFVRRIIENIEALHLDILEDTSELDTINKHQQLITKIHAEIAPTIGTKPTRINTNILEIYHIDENAHAHSTNHKKPPTSDILKRYRIKYKAKLISDENASQMYSMSSPKKKSQLTQQQQLLESYKSIHDQSSKHVWREKLPEKANRLEIAVLGKKREKKPSTSISSSNQKPINGASSATTLTTPNGAANHAIEGAFSPLLTSREHIPVVEQQSSVEKSNSNQTNGNHYSASAASEVIANGDGGDTTSRSNQESAKGKVEEEEYKQISRVVIDFNLILVCIDPKQMRQNLIESKVQVSYKDLSAGETAADTQSLVPTTATQFGFNFKLDDDMKVLLLERMMEFYSKQIMQYERKIDESIYTIENLLAPFSSKIAYSKQNGIHQNRGAPSSDKHAGCSTQDCVIF